MIEWLGIEHLFDLTRNEAIAGFFTPLAVFLVFLVLHLILPARKVPGYVAHSKTGEPREYRLNGLLVFAIVLIVWWFELTGMPRDWFYRSAIYAVAGGTFFTLIFTLIGVYSQPKTEDRNFIVDLYLGRTLEITFLNGRLDLQMYFYIVGGAMLALNALSGAVYHYEQFGENANWGVYIYAAFFTLYILDYFIFERVMLYTYDIIEEKLGLKMFWGDLVVYGWMFIIPLWGLAVLPDPGHSPFWANVILIGSSLLLFTGWAISRGSNNQKYTFKRWPDKAFLGFMKPEYIEAGERKILCSGFWGAARHMNYFGEMLAALGIALVFGYFSNLWAWTYFVFIVSLFLWRQIEDDRVCARKYGEEKWAEYQARVKYRMIPKIY